MYCKSKQTVLPNSISTCFVIPLLAALFCVQLRLLLPVYLPSEKLEQKPTKWPLTDDPLRLSLLCLSFLHFDSLTEVKWQSFLGQWHSLAVVQTAAAEERHMCASIKSFVLCRPRCPLRGERGRRKGEAGWKAAGKEKRLRVWWWGSGEQVCILSVWEYVRASEWVSEKEGGERELAEDWLLTTWTSHLPSSSSSSPPSSSQHHFLFRVHTCMLP